MTQGIGVHAQDHTHSQFLNPKILKYHHRTFLGTWSKVFSRSTKAKYSSLLVLMYLSCSWRTKKMTSVLPILGTKPNYISLMFIISRMSGSGLRTHWEWASSWNLRELIAWPLKFDIEQPSRVLNPCLHLAFISERKLTSIIAYAVLTNDVLVWGYRRYQSVHYITRFLDFHWCFLERPQTSVAASSRGPFSFDQADSMHFAVSASAPAPFASSAAAVIVFTLKADWNWLAIAGSLSFQVWIRVENLHFFTQGMWVVNSHITTWWWCLTHSSLGMIFIMLTALLKLLR